MQFVQLFLMSAIARVTPKSEGWKGNCGSFDSLRSLRMTATVVVSSTRDDDRP
jgi:hypothetical protein